jgi:hypothetical protein
VDPEAIHELGLRGAGDENRTRTISLGNRQIGAPDHADLGIRCTASDPHGPCDTRVNGPPMAHILIASVTDQEPACFLLAPDPYGCLGTDLGYARPSTITGVYPESDNTLPCW